MCVSSESVSEVSIVPSAIPDIGFRVEERLFSSPLFSSGSSDELARCRKDLHKSSRVGCADDPGLTTALDYDESQNSNRIDILVGRLFVHHVYELEGFLVGKGRSWMPGKNSCQAFHVDLVLIAKPWTQADAQELRRILGLRDTLLFRCPAGT